MEKKLYRSRADRMVAGVCGGLAEYFDLDPTVVRVAVVLIALLTQGGIFLAYLIMAIVVPEEPLPAQATPPAAADPSPAQMPATTAEGIVMPQNESPVTGETHATPESVPTPPAVAPAPTAASEPTPAWTTPPAAPVEHHRPRGIGWGISLIVIGALLLAQQFTNIDVWRFWPVIIIALGLSAIIKGVRR
ncbi:MAG: PspC domain-containing protein [Coriobacteriia bacterium]